MSPPSTVLDVLQQTRDLLSDPGRWTRGSFARDADLSTVSVNDDRACAWCLQGALARVTNWDERYLAAQHALVSLIPLDDRDRPVHHLPSLNDQVGHAAVLALLDEAIARESAA